MLQFGGRATDDLSIAHECTVDRRTGSASLRVPVPAPAGRAGFGPALHLVYGSSAGNSPLGSGWSLTGLPSIRIDTRQHLPRWHGTDTYELSGEDLVPWLELVAGQWRQRGFDDGDWTVGFYRSRTSGSQIRVEKWTHRPTGRAHFRTRDARNVLTVFGARPAAAARIADPRDESRTFEWLPELQIDPVGNVVWLEYLAETNDGVDRRAPYERGRPALAQRYLKSIRYGNRAPLALTDGLVNGAAPAGTRWSLLLVFDYGDHADANRPAAQPDRAWLPRLDAFSDCRAGFETRTYRLCRRILSFHDFDELGQDPTLVGALVLSHDEHPAGSTLREIGFVGHRVDAGVHSSRAVPPLVLEYAQPSTATSFIAAPAETQVNVPAGLTSGRLLFVDLLGDGMPGILAESERAWFYKPNQGAGSFGAQTLVLERPATRAGTFTLGDADRDGATDLSQVTGRLAGLFEYARQEDRWIGFRPFPELPHVEGLGARAQWVDLNGDGLSDVVILKSDRFAWFASDDDGFHAPVDVPLPRAAMPTLAEDPSLELFFADMNGDGLVDLVHVQNGRVEYWPSLGNGRFGDPTLFEGEPRFAPDDEFDGSRLRLVDLDGSGTADIIYLGRGEVSIWTNASGNRLLPGARLRSLPYLDSLSSVRVLDFLGDGRPCLVWSSPLPGASALHYLPLTGPQQPRLLLSADNSLGLQTRFAYSTSASHYLRDARRGRPWSTRLPRHVVVVDRREVIDRIGGTRSVERFEYRDGLFDGGRRQFRGFGRVDVYDADVAADPAAFSPPSLTRTWFHHGPSGAGHVATDVYDDPELPPLATHVLSDDIVAEQEIDEALRALTGREIRRETYAVDARGDPGAHPFNVVQQRYEVRRSQSALSEARAGFDVNSIETLTAVYEQAGGDPRVAHHIVVRIDPYGIPTVDAEIAYARRAGRPRDIAAQDETTIVVHEHRLRHFDTNTRFEIGIPLEGRDLELAGVAAAGARLTRERLQQADVAAAFDAPLQHHEPWAGGLAARLVSWDQAFYWNDARTAALAAGDVGARTLVHHEESACFAPAFLTATLQANAPDAARLTQLGYGQRSGLWWKRDERHDFAGPDRFFAREALEAYNGARSLFEYDAYTLEVVAFTDAVNNRTTALIDYHVFAPWRIADANGNTQEARYDALGVIAATTSYGDVDGGAWGFDSLANVEVRVPATVADLLANPNQFLQGAARYIHYDLDAWRRDSTPPVTVSLLREELRYDGAGGGNPDGRVAITLAYSDGVGRVLQEKTLVESGAAIQRDGGGAVVVDVAGLPVLADAAVRWQVSGHVVFDRRQQPGRRYQPYFSGRWEYEGDAVLQEFGISSVTFYDAAGREIERQLPDGTFTTTTHTPWSTEHADANDTVEGSAYAAARALLPLDDPERRALEHARGHTGTTTVVFLDPCGREAGTLARGNGGTDARTGETRFDADGQPRGIVDPRGLIAFTFARDMDGRELRTHSVDAGDTWSLPDALDRVITVWDGRGVEVERTYDGLDRLLTIQVRTAAFDRRVEERVYGEGLPNDTALNLRGALVTVRDQAGEATVGRRDPAGRALVSTRQLRTTIDSEPDWGNNEALEADVFMAETTYDAAGRLRRVRQPDGTTRTLTYLRNGSVETERVTTADGTLADVAVVAGSVFGPRGERTSVTLGNGVAVEWQYHAESLRLTRQIARGAARTFQDLTYTFDPAGNLVRLTDAAHEAPNPLVAGVAVGARRDYAYDAHYRLVRATGRVHQALLQHDYIPAIGGALKGTRHLTLANGQALERFTRTYQYDRSGNLTQIRHIGASQNWTLDMWVSPASNRSLAALDPNGVVVVDPEARFDAVGNLQQMDHLRRLEWSWSRSLAHAVVVERPGGPDDDERYVYSADGGRTRKVSTRVVNGQVEITEKVYLGGCERLRVRLGGNLILERWTSHFIDPVTNGRLALLHRWVRDDLARETNAPAEPRIRYQLQTHQGSSAIELDEQGNLISYEEYFPYGGSSFIASASARDVAIKDYRYSGKERDEGTSLCYFGHRYYAPWIGRWMSPDPVGPEDDLNLYQFVLGDPVGNVDRNGLQTTTPSRLGEVRTGLTERQAINEFNRTQALQAGFFVTDLEPHGNGDWLIKGYRLIPPNALELARQRNDPSIARLFADLHEAFQPLNKPTAVGETPGAGTETAPPPPAGEGGDAEESSDATGEKGQNVGAQEAGTDPNAAPGKETPRSDPNALTPGEGATDRGEGRGASTRNRRGRGQGGTSESVGGGNGGRTSGVGQGTVAGSGAGSGPEIDQQPPPAEEPRTDDPGRNDGAGTDGGDEGGKTGSRDGSPEGVEGGAPGGVPGGVPGGSSTAPPQTGTGTPAVDATGTISGTGTETGGTSPQTGPPGQNGDRGRAAINANGGRDASNTDNRSGSPEGRRREGPEGGGRGGSAEGRRTSGEPGGKNYEKDFLDYATQVAGWANLEFSQGSPNGQRRGVPGGHGRWNLGWFGQVAYIGLTIASFVGPGAILKGLRFGLKLAVRGASLARRVVGGAVGALVRGGADIARSLFRRVVQAWTERRYRTFFSVASPRRAIELIERGGLPWPTGYTRGSLRDIFGPGLYTFATKEQAEAYLKYLVGKGATEVRVLAHRIARKDFDRLHTADLTKMTDEAATAILNLDANHGFQQIIRQTGVYGIEHYFRHDVYHFFRTFFAP